MANLASIADMVDAASVYPLAKRTPLQRAAAVSARLSSDAPRCVWLKREDLQDVFSFKIRGAANRIAGLSSAELNRGVVAASAGNHAQGIAASAKHYGAKATIFMPITTPDIKTKAVRARGAIVKLIGDTYDEACDAAIAYAGETGAVFIHPFDEDAVIAGQGTIAKEILEQMESPPAAVYIAVGGGGLISGIGAYLRTHAPNTKIYAVESEGAPTLKTSIAAGKPTRLSEVDGFADGVAVKMIGSKTFAVIEQIDVEVILVSNDEICAAVKDIFEQTRVVAEPAGALALAGLTKHVGEGTAPLGDLVAIVCGANVNFDRIGYMVERAEFGAGGEILLAATLPETPGAFLRLSQAIGMAAVTEFNYRYADSDHARVLVGIKITGPEERARILAALEAEHIGVHDLTDNVLAKEHLRHMVGGRSSKTVPEFVYSFQFPERPGALLDFLTALDGKWNISLFHYRNHGASAGNVLCGFQVPNNDDQDLEASLATAGFAMRAEHDNPAYQYFLQT